MDWLLLAKAVLMGIVEGLTEFLPVSSTGHLIVAGDLINFNPRIGDVFEIVIQLGAILAVCWEYRERLLGVVRDLPGSRTAQRFVLNLFIAFLPAALVGITFIKAIKAHLFNPVAVACALVVGGLIILWAERRQRPVRIHSIDDMTPLDAFKVGVAQVASLIPGTSRSGSTIIGGMLFGLDRKVATEFSFFLAIPVMFAATFYDVWKHRELFTSGDIPVFSVGFVFAFLSAFVAVRGLIRFVAHHTFTVFAWYRIVFGLIIIATWYFGWVSWNS